MAFTYPLPDPDSDDFDEEVGEDGEVTRAVPADTANEISAVIDAQNTALIAAMQGIASAIQQQLQAQAGALANVWQAITNAALRQMEGQRAVLDLTLAQIAGHVTTALAQQGENVNTTAIHAAMQPLNYVPIPTYYPDGTPRDVPPNRGTPGQPAPGPGAPGMPPPAIPGMPPHPPGTPPGGTPTWPTQGTSTIPLTNTPPPPWQQQQQTGQTSTQPYDPMQQQQWTIPQTQQGTSTVPGMPPQQGTSTVPFDPSQQTQTQTNTQQPGDSSLPLTPQEPFDTSTPAMPGMPPFNPPAAPGTAPFSPPWMVAPPPGQMGQFGTGQSIAAPPSGTQGSGQGVGVGIAPGTSPEVSPPQAAPPVNLQFDPTINITVNAKGGDSYATSTATVSVVNDQQQTISVSPEDDERRNIEVAPEDEERDRQRIRRIFAQAAPGPGDQAIEMPDCPWQLGMKIPKVGSPEWCAQAPAIMNGLALAGNSILNFLTNYIDGLSTLITTKMTEALKRGEWGGNTVLQRIIQMIVTPPIQSLNLLRQMTECWRQLASLAPACDGRIVTGLAGLRMVVKLLRHMQIGINAAVFTIGILDVELDPIEQAIDKLMRMVCPTMLPTPEDAWTAYVRGMINEQTWRCWTLCAGADPDLWRPMLEAHGSQLAADQVILWGRLSGESNEVIDAALYQRGWTMETDRRVTQELYDHWSGGEEFIKWQRDGVLNVKIVEALQLEEGFNAWWKGEPGQMARAHGWREDEARNNYCAMWVRPNPLEMQQYFWRMRKDGSAVRGGITEDVFTTVMAAQGITDWHTQAMLACIYRPLSQPEALIMGQTGQTTWKELLTVGIDSGLTNDQADRMATATQYAGERARAIQESGWTIQSYAAAQSIGYSPSVDAMESLGRQGVTQEMVTESRIVAAVMGRAQIRRDGRRQASRSAVAAAMAGYRVGIIAQPAAIRTMVGAGWDVPSATTVLAATDLQLRAQRTARTIRALERAVLKGELTGLAAAVVLAQMGLRPDAIDLYISLWQADALSQHPRAKIADIRRWVAEGRMTPAQAKLRMANMGWKDPDLTLQVASAAYKLAQAQALALKRNASAQAQAARDAERIKQQALRRLEKHRPVAALGTWYRDGVLTRDQVTRRMKAYGYDDNTIGLYVTGWDNQVLRRKKANAPKHIGALKTPERQVPLGTLKRWFIDEVIDDAYARQRLTDYGYDADTSDRYLSEWKRTAEDRQRRAEAKAAARDRADAGQ